MKDIIIQTICKHLELTWKVTNVEGKPNFTFDFTKASLEKVAVELEPEVNFVSSNVPVNGSAWVILHKGQVYQNIFFTSLKEARNKIKFDYPKRRFKEETENVFVCTYYGTKFKIEEVSLHCHLTEPISAAKTAVSSSDKPQSPALQGVVMCCFQCGCDITPTDNGCCINEGTPHEMYQCNDCHYSEFGVNITGSLLVFK